MDPQDLLLMKKEHSILLVNHRCATELLVIGTFVNYLGILGNLRWFMKKSVSYLPILGWIWALQENILLERNFAKDKAKFGKQLISLFRHCDPFIFTFFPEGTRFTKEKHTASMKIAREKALPELKHHLLPRTKGFVTLVQNLKENYNLNPLSVSIIDVLLSIHAEGSESSTWTLSDVFQGHGGNVKILLRRYHIQDIPLENNNDDGECAMWLQERYQEKDKLLQNYENSPDRNFFSDETVSLPSFQLPKSCSMLILVIFLDVILLLPLISQIITILIQGNYIQVTMIFGGLFLLNYMYKSVIGGIQNDKCSDYGTAVK